MSTCLRGGSIGEGQRAASCEKSAPSPFSHPTAPSKACDSGVVLKLDVNVFVMIERCDYISVTFDLGSYFRTFLWKNYPWLENHSSEFAAILHGNVS